MVNISDSETEPTMDSPASGEGNENAINGPYVAPLSNGYAPLNIVAINSPPPEFGIYTGVVQENQIRDLYGSISAQARRSVRPRLTPASPLASNRYRSLSTSGANLIRGESSSRSRPPGFSPSAGSSTPVHDPGREFSPISILRFPGNEDTDREENVINDVQNNAAEPVDFPGHDQVHADAHIEGHGNAMDANMVEEAQVGHDFDPPLALGLNLFEEMGDDELLQMIGNSGFVIPEDEACKVAIVDRLRQLDRP